MRDARTSDEHLLLWFYLRSEKYYYRSQNHLAELHPLGLYDYRHKKCSFALHHYLLQPNRCCLFLNLNLKLSLLPWYCTYYFFNIKDCTPQSYNFFCNNTNVTIELSGFRIVAIYCTIRKSLEIG